MQEIKTKITHDPVAMGIFWFYFLPVSQIFKRRVSVSAHPTDARNAKIQGNILGTFTVIAYDWDTYSNLEFVDYTESFSQFRNILLNHTSTPRMWVKLLKPTTSLQ